MEAMVLALAISCQVTFTDRFSTATKRQEIQYKCLIEKMKKHNIYRGRIKEKSK